MLGGGYDLSGTLVILDMLSNATSSVQLLESQDLNLSLFQKHNRNFLVVEDINRSKITKSFKPEQTQFCIVCGFVNVFPQFSLLRKRLKTTKQNVEMFF